MSNFSRGHAFNAYVDDPQGQKRKRRPVVVVKVNDAKGIYYCLGITSSLEPWDDRFIEIPFSPLNRVIKKRSVIHCGWPCTIAIGSVSKGNADYEHISDLYMEKAFRYLFPSETLNEPASQSQTSTSVPVPPHSRTGHSPSHVSPTTPPERC